IPHHPAILMAWTKALDGMQTWMVAQGPVLRRRGTAWLRVRAIAAGMVPNQRMAVLTHRAMEGDREATRNLVTLLTPIIQTSVQRVLSRADEVEDVTQVVLLALFAGGKLRYWDPTRGNLAWFVWSIARYRAMSFLHRRRQIEAPLP